MLIDGIAVQQETRGKGAGKEDMMLKGTNAVLEASFSLRLGINVVAQHKAVYPWRSEAAGGELVR